MIELKRVTAHPLPEKRQTDRRMIGRAGDPRSVERRCCGCGCGRGRAAALPSGAPHVRPGLAGVGLVGKLCSWTCSATSLAS